MNLYIQRILINLSIWSMRLRNLLSIEKGDQIMDAYSKIGLH